MGYFLGFFRDFLGVIYPSGKSVGNIGMLMAGGDFIVAVYKSTIDE